MSITRRITIGTALLAVWLCATSVAAAAASSDEPETAAPPKRIVTIAPNAAEIICQLGACDQLVGVSKFCIHPAEVKDRPRVGGLFDPDLEKIVVLRPDLIVLRGHSEPIEKLCTAQGIVLYHDETDTIPGIARCVRELGRRLGRTKQADAIVKRFESRLAAIRQRVKDRPRPRVLLTVSRTPGKLSNILTSAHGTFLDETINIAGGANVFGDIEMTYPQVSTESIVAAAPDVIVELMSGAESTAAHLAEVRAEWAPLATVPAVKRGAIYIITDDNALIPSPRYAGIVEKIASLLHPESDHGE